MIQRRFRRNGYRRGFTLLSRATGLYTEQSVTKGAVTIENDGVAIFVSLDRVTKMLQVLNDGEPNAGLYNNMGRPQSGMKRLGEETYSPPTDLDDLEPAKYATDRVVGHRDTRNQTE